MDKRIPITVAGAEKLRRELDELKRVKRPAVVQAIAEAREKGDLSENAEYDAAKEMQGHIEGRIAELEGKIPMLQIIDPKTLQAGERIVFGATVELEDEDSGNTKSYQIVGDDEADIKENRISISSPLARSLIGKHLRQFPGRLFYWLGLCHFSVIFGAHDALNLNLKFELCRNAFWLWKMSPPFGNSSDLPVKPQAFRFFVREP